MTKRLAAHLPVPAVLAIAALVASATMLVTAQASGLPALLAVLAAGGFGVASALYQRSWQHGRPQLTRDSP